MFPYPTAWPKVDVFVIRCFVSTCCLYDLLLLLLLLLWIFHIKVLQLLCAFVHCSL